MDASSDGSDRRHPSWYPSRIGFVSRRPLPVQGAPSSSPPESLDARSVRVHATGPAGPRRPWDTDGYLSYNNSHFHRSANGGVILPSLSETRLLSRPAVESNPDANSLTDPLSMLSQHDLGRGSRLASQNAPVNLTAPSAPPSSSFQSTTSQTRVLSNNSLPWREAGFTDVYRFPERRWRRVYDRDFASFPNQDSKSIFAHTFTLIDFRPPPRALMVSAFHTRNVKQPGLIMYCFLRRASVPRLSSWTIRSPARRLNTQPIRTSYSLPESR